MGDMIDFWYEYRYVVPKGFTRFFGKLAELTDSGIDVHYFTGNHDQWDFGYLQSELGVQVHLHPEIVTLSGKRCLLAHGDGLNVRSRGEKIINNIFHSHTLQHAFRGLHPTLGMRFGLRWSASNRRKELASGHKDYQGEQQEWLVQYAKQHEQQEHLDYYIFGHRHIMLDLELATASRIVILGDLMNHYSFAQLDEKGQLQLRYDTELFES